MNEPTLLLHFCVQAFKEALLHSSWSKMNKAVFLEFQYTSAAQINQPPSQKSRGTELYGGIS